MRRKQILNKDKHLSSNLFFQFCLYFYAELIGKKQVWAHEGTRSRKWDGLNLLFKGTAAEILCFFRGQAHAAQCSMALGDHKFQSERLERVGPLLTCWNWGKWGLKEYSWKGLPWLVRWACRAGTRDFCPGFAALVSPVQNIFFPHRTPLIPLSPSEEGPLRMLLTLTLNFLLACTKNSAAGSIFVPF